MITSKIIKVDIDEQAKLRDEGFEADLYTKL
jgi:hypothetical protein